MRRNPVLLLRLAGWLAALTLWLPAGSCQAQQDPVAAPPDPLTQRLRVGEYWLGIVSEPLPEALRAQLNVPEGQGLLVERLAPDSPAAAAALERYDVLLKADGKPLAAVQDLIAAIDAAKGKKMQLEVLRKGKAMKVEATPAKRPPVDAARLAPPPPAEALRETMRKWAEQIRPGDPQGRDYSLFFVRPGVVFGRPGAAAVLPFNVSVSITKQGNSAVKIVVTRDNEKWELSEGDLDKLPAELRPPVESMLGYGFRGSVGFERRPPASPVPTPPVPRPDRSEHRVAPRTSPAQSQPIEKQLEDLNRRLDEMRKAVEELNQKQRQQKPSPEAVPALRIEPPKAGTAK